MDVKEAAHAALGHIAELFEDAEYVALEEAVYSDRDRTWNITIGFSRPWLLPPRSGPLAALNPQPPAKREYKVVAIDSETGDVRSVKMREVDDPKPSSRF